jgi:outer membrane protein
MENYNFKLPKNCFSLSYTTILFIVLYTLSFLGYAQPKQQWTLDSCVSFALQNSFTVKHKILEFQNKQIQTHTTKMGILPSVSASVGQNLDFGRSQVASSLIVNGNQTSTSFGVGLNMDLFQGFRTYYQMKSNQFDIQTSVFELDQVRENVEINVMAFYLQVLLNREILEVAKVQEQISIDMLNKTELLVQNGKSSDAELYVAKSTLANDHYNVVEAENALNISILDLAQLINYPNVAQFDIVSMDKTYLIDELLTREINVDGLINNAIQNRPAIKAALNKIDKAKNDIKIAQSTWYPSLSLFANYGTGYNYMFTPSPDYPNTPFNTQFNNNSRQVVGVSLSIPIFDKLTTYDNVRMAKLNVKSQEYQMEEGKLNLIKEIQQAYTSALAAKERYRSAQEYYQSAKIAFEYEKIRYEEGASSSYEFNDAKNKYLKAESQLIQAKFDYIFRIRILEFYGRN